MQKLGFRGWLLQIFSFLGKRKNRSDHVLSNNTYVPKKQALLAVIDKEKRKLYDKSLIHVEKAEKNISFQEALCTEATPYHSSKKTLHNSGNTTNKMRKFHKLMMLKSRWLG